MKAPVSKYSIVLLVLFSLDIRPANVTAKFNIPEKAQPGTQITIEVIVNKGSLQNFGKYNQDLPAGWTAISGNEAGGTFTFNDRTVKIIWVALPSSAEFKFSFNVKVPIGASGPYTISGKFNYIENGQKQTVELAEKTLTVIAGSSAASSQPAPAESKPAAGTKPASTSTSPAAKPSSAPSSAQPSANELTNPSPDQVVYKVQIGAFSKLLPKEKIKNIPEVNYVLENNLYKYFSGNFSSVQAAQLRKQDVAKKGFPGAIIVGYKNGIRVEVIK